MEERGKLAPPIKILHLSGERTWRGGEQQIYYLFEWQISKGLEPYLLCPLKSPLGDRLEARYPHRIFRKPLKGGISFAFALATGRIVRDLKIDLLHLHDARAHTLGWLANLLGFAKLPIVLHRRVIRKPSNSFFTRWKYNHSSIGAILCVSQKVRKVMQAYVIQPQNVHLVYSAIDPRRWEQAMDHSPPPLSLQLSPEKLTIGFIGALEKEKGLLDFLSVAKKIIAQLPCQFLIVGGGAMDSLIKQKAEEEGLCQWVNFTGFVEEVGGYLSSMDLFLFPSLEEGLGTSVLDAMARGIPVVASNVGGIPELLQHGKQGFLADPGDIDSLAMHCLRILKDKDLRTSMGKEGVLRAQLFSVEEMGTAIEEKYKTLLYPKGLN